jgi:hypothetical protein
LRFCKNSAVEIRKCLFFLVRKKVGSKYLTIQISIFYQCKKGEVDICLSSYFSPVSAELFTGLGNFETSLERREGIRGGSRGITRRGTVKKYLFRIPEIAWGSRKVNSSLENICFSECFYHIIVR